MSALLQSNNRHKVSAELMKTIGEKDNHELLQLMGQIVNTIKQNIQANTRQEDPDWFKGIITVYHTIDYVFIISEI